MANQISINNFSNPEMGFPAVAAETILAGHAVNLAGTVAAEAQIVSLADSGEYAEGIAAQDATAGQPLQVITGGVGLALADGTTDIAAGDHLKPNTDSSGSLILATTGNIACAVALQPHTDNSVLPIKVKIVPPFIAR